MKKLVTLIAAALCIGAAAHAETPIKLIVDNKIIATEPITMNDRTLVPLRALMESTGAEVKWNDSDMSIDVEKNGKSIHMQINNPVMTDVTEKTLEAPPILYNDTTTYVPIRAVCEAFSFSVDWDEDTKTVLISDPDGCPYVGADYTLKEYAEYYGISAEDFNTKTGLKYDELCDKPYALVTNMFPVSYVAEASGMDADAIMEQLGLKGENAENYSWGETIGNCSLEQFINISFGQEATDEFFENFKEYYNLGDEYTKNTKYKYVRTILDTKDYNEFLKSVQSGGGMPSEEQLAEYEKALPKLCENKKYFTITLEDGSVMKGELYPDLAKATVENFIKLADEGFYNGLIFHRVIDGFVIQGGGFDKDMKAKEAEAIPGEFYTNGYINPLKHEKGVISMARTNDPNSASSQFFIMDEAAPSLDGQYAAFGRITEGLDVVEKIADSETTSNDDMGMDDVPVKPVVIKSITIDK